MPFFAGIDAGTSAAKVLIVREDGCVAGTGISSYQSAYPKPGYAEQDPEALWSGITKAARTAVENSGISATLIHSVCIASQRGTVMAVDNGWKPLAPAILWSDRRASIETEQFAASFGAKTFHAITGLQLTDIWTAMKIRWFVINRPELFKKTMMFVNYQEWILHKLGAHLVCTDPASITMNGMMDIAQLDWSDSVLKAIGIDRTRVPPVKKTMFCVGSISRMAAMETGFAEGTPLFLGGGDQQCAALGTGTVDCGSISLNIGTGAVVLARDRDCQIDVSSPLLKGGYVFPGTWDIEGIALSAGNCLQWWKSIAWKHEQEIGRTDTYSCMDKEAARAPVGSKGLYFFPFFFGQFVPNYMKQSCGLFWGLSCEHDRPEMTRAILEGIAFELAKIIEYFHLRPCYNSSEHLRVSGGGARSDFWMQMLADILNTTVDISETRECTALGATILGAAGSGFFPSLETAAGCMVKSGKTFFPDPSAVRLYKNKYHGFWDLYGKVTAVF